MKVLHEPPRGFDTIAKAFAMAKHLPASQRLDLKIGLVHGDRLFATGRLDGYRQVEFFSDHLRDDGWTEHLPGGEHEMFGCDMLFAHPADAGGGDDPSFIRRAPVELWPAGSTHAKP